MNSDLLSKCLVATLVVQLALPLSLRAEGLSQPEFFVPPQRAGEPLPAELAAIVAELEQADEHTPVQGIPDPFHLTQQYLLVMRSDGNSGDRYHLAGTEGGLPPIVPQPNAVQAVNFGGNLALRYKHGVHVIESITPALIAYDRELLVVVATDASVYALDMTFARRNLFKAPLPVHKVPMTVESEDLSGLQAGFITRGFNPFTQVLTERDTRQSLSATRRFTAGDLVLWREHEEQRVLLSVVARNFIVAAINNGNHLLGSLALALRKEPAAALGEALKFERQQGQQFDDQQLNRHQRQSSAASKQVLQNMGVERLQEILLNDIEMNNYRDDFTYAQWQRDYLLLKKQAEVTVKQLRRKLIKDGTTKKHITALEQQLHHGDLGGSWLMLSKLYVEEARGLLIDRITALKSARTPAATAKIAELERIVAANDFHRLWHEPQLLASEAERLDPARLRVSRFFYQHLSGDDLRYLAATAAGIGGLGLISYAAARALKTGFSLAQYWPPAPFRIKDLPAHSVTKRGTAQVAAIRVGYSRYLKMATVLGVAIIPAVAAVGWLTARSSGEDWDFRKQLTLMGIRACATLAQPFWHYLANFTGQKTLMPSLAAQLSPFTAVRGDSELGASIGLQASESVRIGWLPFSPEKDDEALRRRAIMVLQQQRVRAQGLGWEMAARIIWQEWLKQHHDAAYDDLATVVLQSGFQQRWKRLAVGLEAEIARLQREGIFPDLRTVSYEKVHDFLTRTKPHVLEVTYHDNLLRNAGRAVRGFGDRSLAYLATVATDDVNFLRTVDPDDFVSSKVWHMFMVDFFTVVALEGTFGSRSLVFGSADDLQHLLATNKFPFMHLQHRYTMADQIYAYQVRAQGRYSLVFQMLEKIKESDYAPLEETLLVGKENPQSFVAGLADLGGNSLDLRNVDYGTRFVRALSAMLVMMQVIISGGIVTRFLIAKASINSVLPQIFFRIFWGVWGYAWPWIVYNSSEHLREAKHDTRLGMLRQAKVQLRKALDRDDSDAMRQGYQALVEVYRRFNVDVPPALKREVEQIEMDLRISDEERLSVTELLPHLAALVQMNSSDDPAAKRAIYRQISAYVDGEQPARALSHADAERVLNFVMLNPPFPTSLNYRVSDLGVVIGAVTTTVMASWFFRNSFNLKRLREVVPYVLAGSTIYAGTWLLLEKNNTRKIWRFIREDLLGYPPDDAPQY